MDDLLNLFDEEETNRDGIIANEGHAVSSTASSSPTATFGNRNHTVTPLTADKENQDNSNSKNTIKKGSSVDARVDHLLGIRMIQRKMGSLDLLELISTSNHYTPTTLASMSLAALNSSILVDPTPVVDAATVCGRTNLLTVGVVFSNSGTKLSNAGNAFCVVTMASNLQSAPSVSILLFGYVYGKHCRTLTPGKVIAVKNPRLIPLKTDGGRKQDTAITFSVSDTDQLTVIADARDFGTCQAGIRGKNSQGTWVSDARICAKPIDTRVSKFCQQHRHLENVRPGPVTKKQASNNNNNNKGNKFHQLKMEMVHGIPPLQQLKPQAVDGAFGRKVLVLPNNKGQQTNSILAATSLTMLHVQHPHSLQPQPRNKSALEGVPRNMTKTGMAKGNTKTVANNALHGLTPPLPVDSAGIRRNVPNRKTSSSTNSILNPSLKKATAAMSNPLVSTKRHNPYTTKPTINATNTIEQRQKRTGLPGKPIQTTKLAATDWLQKGIKEGSAKKGIAKQCMSSTAKKPRSVNTDGRFDGSVCIPKPSKLLFSSTSSARTGAPVMRSIDFQSHNQFGEHEAAVAEEILAKQKEFKERLHQPQGESMKKSRRGNTAISSSQESRPSFFDTAAFIDEKKLDVEAIINAKSRFATEADAEDYAKRRQNVVELEQKEERSEKIKEAKNRNNRANDRGNGAIVREWMCKTCGHQQGFAQPISCIRNGHKVLCRRTIKEVASVADKRLKLTNTDAKDGGLVLGSGLEWSKWSSFI